MASGERRREDEGRMGGCREWDENVPRFTAENDFSVSVSECVM